MMEPSKILEHVKILDSRLHDSPDQSPNVPDTTSDEEDSIFEDCNIIESTRVVNND